MSSEPHVWTADEVAEAVRDGFRKLRHTSIWVQPSRAGNQHESVGLGPSFSAEFNMLAFAGTVLGQGSDEHRALMIWARATADTGETKATIAECCAALRIDKSTLWRRRRRACARIAKARIVADRVPYHENVISPLDSAIGADGPHAGDGGQPVGVGVRDDLQFI